ncbi:hypothetical protein [Candidatus Uabimicrobium amorphum]|uniref:Uncharacterized protein n=1 Tax=Uabimicrobium amorphum TaxID=2596890 RepID=A0A5S9F4G1_UABAM|nr:hypothetical protein [Candidatus Uabimicrobium amorphum]BBM85261.1 hypothetical protein UABAM_03624 [Candidatus Uabimicrobium amorphum]
MSEPQWKKLEQEMLGFQLQKPALDLKQKCLTTPPAPGTFFSWPLLAAAAALIIVASWSSYENFAQQKNFNNNDTTSVSHLLKNRLDTNTLPRYKKFSTTFVKDNNTYTIGGSRAKWLQ